ncbi:MAG: phosphodiester glycosidase family protein [Niameybacter sp.]
MSKHLLKIFFKSVGITLGSLFLIGIASFYILIMSGWLRPTQDLWVTTAMTTLNHKWLATAFINEEKIEEIMKRNQVDDSGFETSTDLVQIPSKQPDGHAPSNVDTPLIDASTYLDQGYRALEEGIYLKDVSGSTWKGKLMLIENPARVQLAQTRYQFERGDLVKTMVATHNARAGINAGGFVDGPNYDSNGGTPAGLLIVDNQLVQSNGDMEHSVIGFNQDSVLVLGKMTKQEALDANLRDAVDFRPFLIVNGEITIKEGTGGWGIAPRTAIGQRPTGEVLFLCIDGRQPGHSIGVDLDVLQNTLLAEGCINAAMLDGGSSTVMYYDNNYVNQPSLGHERYINNAWIIQ